jgi:hypothetical protein
LKIKDDFSLSVRPGRAAARDLAPLRPRFFFRPAPPAHRHPQPPDRVEDQLVDLLEDVKDVELMVGLRPQLREHGRVEVRAFVDHEVGHQPPGLEALEQPPHVIVIVGADQGEGHRQVANRIGGQEQREPAQVHFIDAEGATEVVQDHAAVLGHVELLGPDAEQVVNETGGQVEEELAAQRLQGPFDAHAVLEDAFQDQVADLVIVEGPGKDPLGGRAEGRTAVTASLITASLIFATGDLQVGDGLVGDGADPAGRQFPFATAVLATLGARGLLGCAVNR